MQLIELSTSFNPTFLLLKFRSTEIIAADHKTICTLRHFQHVRVRRCKILFIYKGNQNVAKTCQYQLFENYKSKSTQNSSRHNLCSLFAPQYLRPPIEPIRKRAKCGKSTDLCSILIYSIPFLYLDPQKPEKSALQSQQLYTSNLVTIRKDKIHLGIPTKPHSLRLVTI